MPDPYTYQLRPGFNSGELLIEFGIPPIPGKLLDALITVLQSNGFHLISTEDVWANSEIFINMKTQNGTITISKDNWNLIFIMSNENQKDILKIDEILMKSDFFKKEE